MKPDIDVELVQVQSNILDEVPQPLGVGTITTIRLGLVYVMR